jgi:tight adherence protein C
LSGAAEVLGMALRSGWSWPGAASGVLLLVGAALVVAGLPINRRPTLDARLEPYLRDTPRPSTLLARPAPPRGPLGFGALLAPYLAQVGKGLGDAVGGSASVARRLLRAGQQADVDRFRAEQVLWGTLGAVVGLIVTGLVAVAQRRIPMPFLVGLVICGAVAGFMGRDYALTRQAGRREARMLTEFPTVAELLALAVSAGEGAVGALERVCRLSHGELSDELRRCLADARAGANLPTALQGLADRTGLTSLTRFVDGIVVAVERGTPLADVLRAQAQDVREDGRRTLMAQGGRKEILMMVPIVFLTLPVTVLFAVYPGVRLLHVAL